jgi:hypothetical protein
MWGRVWLRWAFAMLTTASLFASTRVDYLDPWMHGDWQERSILMAGVVNTLHRGGVTEGQHVFLTTSGFISVTSVWYQFAKNGWPIPDIYDYAFSGELREIRQGIENADWVVASAPGCPGAWGFLPTTKLAGDSLHLAAENPRFRLYYRIATEPRHEYYIFRRVRPPK